MPRCYTTSNHKSEMRVSDPLDNPVWHALTGPQAALAVVHGRARHYPHDMAPFSAIDRGTPEAYSDLAGSLAPRTEARLFRLSDEPLPTGWEAVKAFPMLQMVLPREAPQIADSYPAPDDLSDSDAAAALELARAADPGPFGPRTLQFGGFIGHCEGGQLVAMAGERMRLPGYTELSAICTHPNARGRGHGVRLTRCLMNRIVDRGEIPFLHIRNDNPALELYRRLGFVVRREIWVLWRRPKVSTA